MSSPKRARAARKAVRTKGPAALRRAGKKAVAQLPRGTVTRGALSRQARDAASRRGAAELSRAARKAARTRARVSP